MVDLRIWKGRLKVGEPSGVGCLRNQRESSTVALIKA